MPTTIVCEFGDLVLAPVNSQKPVAAAQPSGISKIVDVDVIDGKV